MGCCLQSRQRPPPVEGRGLPVSDHAPLLPWRWASRRTAARITSCLVALAPPHLPAGGGHSPKLCSNLPLAPLLRFDPHGGKDHVLPCGRGFIAPTFGDLRPRLRVCALPFQHLPSGGEHGAGTDAQRCGGLRYVVRVFAKKRKGAVCGFRGGFHVSHRTTQAIEKRQANSFHNSLSGNL